MVQRSIQATIRIYFRQNYLNRNENYELVTLAILIVWALGTIKNYINVLLHSELH